MALEYNRADYSFFVVFGGKKDVNFNTGVVRIIFNSLTTKLHFEAHSSEITASAFHQQKQELIVAAADASVLVWKFDKLDSISPTILLRCELFGPSRYLLRADTCGPS